MWLQVEVRMVAGGGGGGGGAGLQAAATLELFLHTPKKSFWSTIFEKFP